MNASSQIQPSRTAPVVYLTPDEVVTRTRYAKATLATFRSRGGGPPFVKLGGKVLYPEAEVEAFLAAATVQTSTSSSRAVQARRGRPRRQPAGA